MQLMRRKATVAAATSLAARLPRWPAAVACALLLQTASAQTVAVRIIAINDFHGHLEHANNTIRVPDPGDPSSTVALHSGGAPFLAARIAELRAEQPQHVVVSAGDLVGASPLISGLFHDEPTVEVMNAIGLDVHALGNHEFDYGVQHLLRLAKGGCATQPQQRSRAGRAAPEQSRSPAHALYSSRPTRCIATPINPWWLQPGSKRSTACVSGSSAP